MTNKHGLTDFSDTIWADVADGELDGLTRQQMASVLRDIAHTLDDEHEQTRTETESGEQSRPFATDGTVTTPKQERINRIKQLRSARKKYHDGINDDGTE